MASVASLTALALLLLGGCATQPLATVAARVDVVPSRELVVGSVTVEGRGASTLVTGSVMRRTSMSGRVSGRLHVEAWGARGLLAVRDTRWSPLHKRRIPSSRFYVQLPAEPAEVEQIRISHVPDSHRHACSSGNCQ